MAAGYRWPFPAAPAMATRAPATAAQVRRDLAHGYISDEVAIRDYGLTEADVAEVHAAVRSGQPV